MIAEAADEAMYPRDREGRGRGASALRAPERYLVWVGGLRHPDPAKHIAKLAAAQRELPLVLVGSTRPWAHELPNVILTGQVGDEQLAAIYTGAHALVLSSEDEGFGLSGGRGARVRHAGGGVRRARAARGAGRACDVRGARATWLA